MAANLAAQLAALINLSVAYMGARDFTTGVLQRTFGNGPWSPAKCAWPPPGIEESEIHLRLLPVQDFLQQCGNLIQEVVRDAKAAQVDLIESGFDMPRSWVIANPLENFVGGFHALVGISEIVATTPAEHDTVKRILGEIEVELVMLKGKVAGAASVTSGESITASGNADSKLPTSKPKQSEGNGGAGSAPAKARKTKRGRKKLSSEETKRRTCILSAWEQARNARTPMKTFCQEHDPSLSLKELELIVAWKAQRNRRKDGS